MAYYIAATARIVDVDSEEVINRGAVIKSRNSSAAIPKELRIGSVTNFNVSSYYQYWEAELESGYTFDHWNVTTSDPAGGGRQDPPASKDFDSNPTGQWSFLAVASRHQTSSSPLPYTVTLYVKTEPPPPVVKTVTLNPNGGTVNPATIQCTVGGTYGVIPIPTRSGWRFTGWYDAQTGGNQIEGDTPFTDNSPTMLWAHWEEIPVSTFILTFDDAGGSGGPGSVEVREGSSYTIPTTPPTRESYTFEHWLSGADEYNPGDTITPTGDMTFVAIWSGGPIPPRPPRPDDQKDFMVYSSGSGVLAFNRDSGAIVYAI